MCAPAQARWWSNSRSAAALRTTPAAARLSKGSSASARSSRASVSPYLAVSTVSGSSAAWTVAEVGLGLRPGTPGLSTDVDQDQAGGIHALQHTTTRGDVCGEEFPETGTGVDVELRKAPFEPNVSR